jgi:hypothetical protein
MENKEKVTLSSIYGEFTDGIKSAQSASAFKMLEFMRRVMKS